MKTDLCETCRYFEKSQGDPIGSWDVPYGSCRRGPPVLDPRYHKSPAHDDGNMVMCPENWVWPAVRVDEWCGEYRNRNTATQKLDAEGGK